MDRVIRNVGITAIGSGVGQSIVNSCRLSQLPLRTIGLGTNPLAFGAFDCDERHPLPSIYAPDYVEALLERVQRSQIDVIVPGLDDELPALAAARERFEAVGCGVIVSGPELVRICRDKERMSRVMAEFTPCFVRTWSKETVGAALASGEARLPLIAKPRAGSASRGVVLILRPEDLARTDEHQVIQEIAVPHRGDPCRDEFLGKLERGVLAQVSEISVQLVTDRDGELLGRFASYNRLSNGVPIEVLPFDSEILWREMDRLLAVWRRLGLRGPLNVQGRLTDDGLKFFEMNARFTGITGLRALMGFPEVEACLGSWLGLAPAGRRLERHPSKVGIRQTADRTVDRAADPRIEAMLDPRLRGPAAAPVRRVLVTGASGHVGSHLVRRLASSPAHYEVTAAGRSPGKLRELFADLPGVKIAECSRERLLDADGALFDCVVHCAFTRAHGSNAEIAASLDHTQRLFDLLSRSQVGRIVNLSSRVVYDPAAEGGTEDCPVGPASVYAMAKHASELMLVPFRKANPAADATNVRLSAVSGGTAGPHMADLITKLVKRALRERRIDIVGGHQRIDVLNVRDAAEALRRLIDLPAGSLPPALNLGGPPVGIVDLARAVQSRLEEARPAGERVELAVTAGANAVTPRALDTSAMQRLTGWTAVTPLATTIDETIRALSVEVLVDAAPAFPAASLIASA
jgi:nucleoside-diphosphate-sugar epimerase